MSKKLILLAVCLIGLGGLFLFLKAPMAENAGTQTQTQNEDHLGLDHDNKLPRSPMFKDVKRVYIEVSNIGTSSRYNLPSVLEKENIEKLLLDMFSARFSKDKCHNARKYGLERDDYEYDCNDQPVKIATPDEQSAYYEYTYGRDPDWANKNGLEEVIAPGSLYIKFIVNINHKHPDDSSTFINDTVFIYYITMTRPEDGRYMAYSPNALPINQNPEIVKSMLKQSILNRLTL